MNKYLIDLADDIHHQNVEAGWWTDPKTGESIIETRERQSLMLLAISELSEAYEGYILNIKDDHLPQYWMVDVELIDCTIRMGDICGIDVTPYIVDGLILDERGVPVQTKEFNWSSSKISMEGIITTFVNYISAALEGYRKGNMPIYRANLKTAYEYIFEVSVRLMGFIEFSNILDAKREYNRNRLDHKMSNRVKEGGKVY